MLNKYEKTYINIKNNVEDYIEIYDYKNMNEKNLSAAFGNFIIQKIFDINDNDADDAITDNFHDNGIDAIYIEQDRANLFQFKFPSKIENINKGISETEIKELFDGLNFITGNDKEFNSLTWNEKLIEKRNDLQEKEIVDYKIWIVRYTNKVVSGEQIDLINAYIQTYKDKTGNNLDYEIITAKECVNFYEFSYHKKWPDFNLKYFKDLGNFNDTINSTYCAIVSLEEIYNSFKDIENSVYEGNVRYLYNKSAINDEIKDSIINNKECFYLLNNGITIVCKQCSQVSINGYYKILSGSIINGTQTVGTIIKTINESGIEPSEFSKSYVHVKIVSLSDENLILKMTYTLNSQNTMKLSYSIANKAVLIDLQNRINNETEYYLELKNNQFDFEKSNNHLTKLRKNKINIELLVQLYVSFNNTKNMASLVKNGKSKIFETETIEDIINNLDYDNSIYLYKLYLKVMQVVNKYKQYYKDGNKEILSILSIESKNIDDYKYLYTGNMMVMYTLGLLKKYKGCNPDECIAESCKILAKILNNQKASANLTRSKEKYLEIEEYIIKN